MYQIILKMYYLKLMNANDIALAKSKVLRPAFKDSTVL